MANAGKVAITPKGEFVNGTSYERLDTVTFEGNLYIAKKANANVLPTDTECWMKALDMDSKLDVTGDTKDNTVTFTSVDSTEAEAWTDVETLETGEKHSSIFNKISTMFKNIRFLYKILGTTDISEIGEGTITSALSVLNGSATSENYGRVKVTDSSAVTDSTGLALAATEKNASIDGTLAKQIDELNSNLSNIGKIKNINSDSFSVETDTDKITCSLTLEANTIYIIFGSAYYRTNANGTRMLMITTGSEYGNVRGSAASCAAATNGFTMLNTTMIVRTSDKSETYNLVAKQDSGETITISGKLVAISIR